MKYNRPKFAIGDTAYRIVGECDPIVERVKIIAIYDDSDDEYDEDFEESQLTYVCVVTSGNISKGEKIYLYERELHTEKQARANAIALSKLEKRRLRREIRFANKRIRAFRRGDERSLLDDPRVKLPKLSFGGLQDYKRANILANEVEEEK